MFCHPHLLLSHNAVVVRPPLLVVVVVRFVKHVALLNLSVPPRAKAVSLLTQQLASTLRNAGFSVLQPPGVVTLTVKFMERDSDELTVQPLYTTSHIPRAAATAAAAAAAAFQSTLPFVHYTLCKYPNCGWDLQACC
jgi:hypothetical protein